MQQSTPKGSDHLGFGKYGAKTEQEVLQVDRDYCNWVDQVEVPQSHWKLKRFSTWLKMQSVFQDTNLENNMTQEWMTRRIKQLEEEKLLAEMQASKELDQRRNSTKTVRRHLKHSLGGGEQRAEGGSQEVDGTSTTFDEVLQSERSDPLREDPLMRRM